MLPEIFLFVWALVVISFDLLSKRNNGSTTGYLTLFGIAIAGLLLGLVGNGKGFGKMFINDNVAVFFKVIFLGAAFMAVGSSFGVMQKKIVNHRGEFYALLLMSTTGMMFLSSSQELLSIYLGLELTTIPLFAMAAFYKDDKLSVESGIKYFIIGAFSSALMVYGMSFLYGLTGSTDLAQMKVAFFKTHLQFGDMGIVMILALIMLAAGIGFKLALPPFHQWAPDVYEGAPTPVAAFLSVGSKGAGLIAFAKIFVDGLYAYHSPDMAPNDWGMLIGILAIAAMVLGNVLAIRQTNIKRMLAYSSIAQAGYIMIGMVALSASGIASVGFYLFIYLFANMGAFAAVAVFEDMTGSCQIKSYAGLARTSPFFSAVMAVFLLSLAGIPPLAGFLAKYYVFASVVDVAQRSADSSWMYWMVGIGLLTTVFALFYYANVIKVMFFSPETSPYKVEAPLPAKAVLAIGVIGVLLFGLYPEPILQFATGISSSLHFMP